MGRPKSKNPMNEKIALRMNPQLRLQLEKYCKHKNKLISETARKAIEKFIEEENNLNN